MKIRVLFWTALFTVFTSLSFAGWVFTEKSTGDWHTTTYIQNNRIKIAEAEQIQILDLNKNLVCIINSKDKTFWTGTAEEFANQGKKAIETIGEIINQQLAWFSPAQKESLKQDVLKLIKKHAIPKVEIKQSSEKDKIAGHEVKKHEIWVDGKLRWENWIASDIPVAKEFDIKKFGKMMTTFQSGFGYGEGIALWSDAVMDAVNKGWTLRTVYFEDEENGAFQIDEIAKAEKKNLADSEFEVPKNYRKINISEVFVK